MSDFLSAIDKFIAKANGNVEQVVKQTVVLAAQGVIQRTPVDTGRARGNWVFGAGVINEEVVDSRRDPTGSAAMGAIAAAVLTVRVEQTPYLYITNSLPYIHRLEDGWSQQAPAGMVKSTLAALPAAIERYARGLS